jgi:hypothetical protein
VLAFPHSLLDSYMAMGFAGAWVGPPFALVHSNASATASGNNLIWSSSVSLRSYKSLMAVTSCSSTAVASIIPPGEHSQSSSWLLPDSDGYNVSSLNNYRGHCLVYGGSYPCYGGSGMPANWHSSSWFGSSVGRPSPQFEGPSFHPQDVPPFILPQDGALIPSGFVPHAMELVASSLGGTVALLSSLCHVDVASLSDSDLTMSFSQAQAFGGHFGPAPDPGYQHLLAVPTSTIPPGVLVTHGGLPCVVPAAPGGFLLISPTPSMVSTVPWGLPPIPPALPAALLAAPPAVIPVTSSAAVTAAPPAMVPVASPVPHVAPLGICAELFKLNPIKVVKSFLNLLEQIQFYLRMPEFSTGHANESLTTNLGNQEASQVWEGQLHLTVWDGTLQFIFKNKGSQFHGRGFKILATLM